MATSGTNLIHHEHSGSFPTQETANRVIPNQVVENRDLNRFQKAYYHIKCSSTYFHKEHEAHWKKHKTLNICVALSELLPLRISIFLHLACEILLFSEELDCNMIIIGNELLRQLGRNEDMIPEDFENQSKEDISSHVKTISNTLNSLEKTELEKITSINLSNNPKLSGPFSIVLPELPKLKSLDFSNTNISSISAACAYGKTVETINISNTKICYLPRTFGYFNALEKLSINNLHISSIPKPTHLKPEIKQQLLRNYNETVQSISSA